MDFERIKEKLAILADAAKYDMSCASSGGNRKGKKGALGNTASFGSRWGWFCSPTITKAVVAWFGNGSAGAKARDELYKGALLEPGMVFTAKIGRASCRERV